MRDKVRSETRFAEGLLAGFAWTTVATAFIQGSTFVASVLVARALGKEGFGQFTILYGTLLTIANIAQFAIGLTATRFIAESLATEKIRAGRVLGFASVFSSITGGAGTLALLFSGSLLAVEVLNSPELAWLFAASSAYILFSVLSAYQTGSLMGLQGQRALGLVSIPAGLVHVVALALGAAAGGLPGVVVGLLVSGAIRWLALGKAVKHQAATKGVVPELRNLWEEWKTLTSFALPAAMAGISTLPALWLTQVFLAQQDSGFEDVGAYSAANNLRMLILFLPIALNSAGTARLSFLAGSGDVLRYRRALRHNFALAAALLLVSVGVVIGFADPLLHVFGKDFVDENARWVVAIMALAALVEGLAASIYQIILSHAKMWQSLWIIALPRDLTLIGLGYILIPVHGSIGLALAYVAAHFLAFCATVLIALRLGTSIPTR